MNVPFPASVFPISDVASIHRVQEVYADDFSHKSAAQELLQNSLNENQRGDIQIRSNLILLTVRDVDQKEIHDIEERINSGLAYAKKCYTNKAERLKSLEDSQKHLKSHGRGFLLMFYLGWDIITLQSKNTMLIAAIRH